MIVRSVPPRRARSARCSGLRHHQAFIYRRHGVGRPLISSFSRQFLRSWGTRAWYFSTGGRRMCALGGRMPPWHSACRARRTSCSGFRLFAAWKGAQECLDWSAVSSHPPRCRNRHRKRGDGERASKRLQLGQWLFFLSSPIWWIVQCKNSGNL